MEVLCIMEKFYMFKDIFKKINPKSINVISIKINNNSNVLFIIKTNSLKK